MMKPRAGLFRDRRGAIAMMFALSLIPLTMMVALSIDVSFYSQAKAQYQLAGDAAATYAIREANATYVLESAAAGVSTATATSEAVSAGQTAGLSWFNSQLATLPRAFTSTSSPPTVKVQASSTSTGSSAGFTATVNYTGVYPPFFDLLFHSTQNWNIVGSSTAASAYSYAEILLLLDTSGSMLIGANETDIQALAAVTACVPNNEYGTGEGYVPYSSYYQGDEGSGRYQPPSSYTGLDTSSNIANGTCDNTKGVVYNNGGPAVSPCAFACHTTTATAPDGYTQDYFGMARRLNPNQTPSANGGVTLRLDAVFLATETVINDMKSAEQVSGQFTVGVYQFNDNVAPIVYGTSSDVSTEATADLSTALAEVKADDWMQTPGETAVPILSAAGESTDFTNFPLAMSNLQNGTFANVNFAPNTSGQTSGLTLNKLTAAGSGAAPASPQKDLFIVTDGMEDSTPSSVAPSTCPACSSGRLMGEMTGVAAEAAAEQNKVVGQNGTLPAVCNYLKQTLGFTIYVLYVTYDPIPVLTYYYAPYASPSTDYTNQDFPALAQSQGGTIENWVEGDNTGNIYQSVNPNISPSPDLQALQACASAPSDVLQATDSADISTDLENILKSALSSTTRITD